jgi:hypothetical protein
MKTLARNPDARFTVSAFPVILRIKNSLENPADLAERRGA